MAKEPTDLKLVFDLETTGLNSDKDEILEAAIVTTDGEILFESRFKPVCVTEWPGAQNVNGISPEMVADAPGIIDKIGEMAALLQNAETIIGYNGKHFDIPFLGKYGIKFRPDAVIDDPMLYGAVVYGELRGEGENTSYKWQKLSVLAEHFGYKDAGWHNAAADCIATAYVWHKLQEPEMVERYNANLARLNEIFENGKDSQKVNSVSDFAERYREEKEHSSAREL
ncbi:3'-5' exonuclease [Oscillospiraceae bacterium LCP21S3_A1]